MSHSAIELLYLNISSAAIPVLWMQYGDTNITTTGDSGISPFSIDHLPTILLQI